MQEPEVKIEQKSKVGEFGRVIRGVLSGEVLGSEALIQNLPFISFLVFLSLIYIGIGFTAEGSVRQINRDKAELKEMRSEYITIKSDLMYTTKQSELVKVLKAKGLALEESMRPPKKIEITKKGYSAYQKEAVSGE
jgi:hypothetical protein